MSQILESIKLKTKNSNDLFFREISVGNQKFELIFSDAMVDSELVSNFVVRSITQLIKEKDNKENNDEKLDLKTKLMEKLNTNKIDIETQIAISKVEKIDINKDDVFKYIFSGFVVIIYEDEVYVVEAKSNLIRSISQPTTENSIRGARDSFVESIMQNLGLIRNRIKTEKLAYKESEIGRRTKTKVGVMYVEDIAKPEMVNYIEAKLQKIDIDGILDVNYIQEFIESRNDSDFPVSITTERPDIVSYYLLQGRVAILVNNSPYVLIVPAFFDDFLNNIDDLYQKSKNVTLTKIIRYISMILTIIIPALYLSLITFDQETIPTDLLASFAAQREGVPFPAVVEAGIMIMAFEILKESDMRSNKVSGNTLSIVGALILGDAAVSAGIVSPIMIIVVAITTISGLIFSDINVINGLRKWRIVFMLFASLCGIVGIGIASIMFVASLVSTKSYTLPFTYPVAPLNFTQVKHNLITRIKISEDKKRQKILTNNLTKSR